MELEQELRDILQRDAAELVPVGPGPEDARRRAFRRKRRLQSGVVIISAAGLVGGTLAVLETRDPSHGPGPRVQTQPIVPTSDLVWRTADGTVLQGVDFTTPAGITYALSTAPGSKPNTDNGTAPQELYATRDGVTWTHESLGANPWVVDLTESKGVLYAVGTGPGAQTGSVGYNLATSTDNGARWSVDALPVEFTAPKSAVPLTSSRSVHVARGAHTTVAMAKVSYWADVSKVLGDAAYNETAGGVQIMGAPTCKQSPVTTAPVSGATDPCNKMTVVSTRPWSDFGISDPAALHQQQALVRDDGGSWSKVEIPASPDSWVTDVSATSNGFLMVEQLPGTDRVGNVQLWSSPDGRSWAPLSGNVPKFDTVSIAGDRVIGIDSISATLSVSNDAGATWTVTANVDGLLPSGAAIQPYGSVATAGPLGYAALVRSGDNGPTGHSYLLHSSDGTTWKVTDLAAAGAPANGQIASVSVGADHIDVSYEVPQGVAPDGAAASYKLVEMLGTPKAS